MVGFSFDQVSGEKTMKLTQLAVSGYTDVAYFMHKARKGVKSGIFTLTVLDKGGSAALDANGKQMKWCYVHSYDTTNAKWNDDAHWIRQIDGVTIDDTNDVTFDGGQGFWFEVSGNAYPDGVAADKYTLVNSGKAVQESRSVLLRNGNKGVAVPLSASVKLTKMSVDGYQDVAYFQHKARKGVKSGIFTVTVLDKGGSAALDANGKQMKWCYLHSYDTTNAKWNDDAHWIRQSDSVTIDDSNDVTFEAGQGFWVEVSGNAYPDGVSADKYTLVFPGVED